MEKSRKISKVLSKNDTGETGGHQAGILIPKDKRILSFFPKLGNDKKNPRVQLCFTDDWIFVYIYYNNWFFGGTRNEYRLTRMTKYIRSNVLLENDQIILYLDEKGQRRITCNKSNEKNGKVNDVLRINKSWKIINF